MVVTEVGGDLLPGLHTASDGRHMAAQHAVPLGGHGLDGEVDGGVRGKGRGALGGDVDRRVQRVVGVRDLLHGRHVRAGRDDRADGGGERGDAARGDRAHHCRGAARGTDLDHRGVRGEPFTFLRDDGGDLAGDGALQEVTALAVRQDGGRAHGGGDGAGHGPHGGGGHDDDGHGQHEPALRAGEAHREVEFLGRLELGEGLLTELHGASLTCFERGTAPGSPGTGGRFRDSAV